MYQLVGSLQLTESFIKYLYERDIIHLWRVAVSGEEIALTFETEKETDT